MEQQFHMAEFKMHVSKMSKRQAQDFLVKLHEQMMLKDNAYKQMLRADWEGTKIF